MKDLVVLFAPKSTHSIPHIGVPLGLLAIGTPLKKAGFRVKIVDWNLESAPEEKILPLLENALCLAITSMTGPQIKNALAIAKRVKVSFPSLPIVWGGYHPSIMKRQTLESDFVDVVVEGRAERTFLELVKALQKNSPLQKIKGIAFKQKGKIIENPEREIEDINKMPPMDYSLLDNVEKYIVKTHYADRTIDYVSSFGCPYNCGFCSEIKVHKRKWSGLKAERVIKEIKHLVKAYGANGIRFADSNFFVDKERVRKICEGFLREKLNIKWGNANGRTEQLVRFDDSLWQLMTEVGLSDILIGAEAASQELLNFINKGATVDDTLKLKRIAGKYGLTLFVSLMIGIPFKIEEMEKQTKKQLDSVLDLVEKLNAIDDRHYISIFIYTPFPGSPLYDYCIKHGVAEPASLEEWASIDLNSTNLPWVPKKYVSILDHLQGFIFLYTTFFYGNFAASKFGLVHKIFRKTAAFRLRHRFFAFPIEYKIAKFFFTRHAKKQLHQ